MAAWIFLKWEVLKIISDRKPWNYQLSQRELIQILNQNFKPYIMSHVIENSLVRECSFFSLLSTVSLWLTVSWVSFPSISDMWNAEVWISSPFLWQFCLQWLWKVCNIHYLSWPWVSCITSQDLAKLKLGMSNLHTNKFSVMTESELELRSPLPSHPRWLSDSPKCRIHIPSPTSSLSTIMAESVYPVLI